tara:strand:- start:28764 stop:29048 length:285 start_codon:yes stop_codon:yes gene_type:complete
LHVYNISISVTLNIIHKLLPIKKAEILFYFKLVRKKIIVLIIELWISNLLKYQLLNPLKIGLQNSDKTSRGVRVNWSFGRESLLSLLDLYILKK